MKWIFAPKTFNQLVKENDQRTIEELHNFIVKTVRAHTKGKTYTPKRWDLNAVIIDNFERRFGQKITRTTPDKWRRRILENDASKINAPINWFDSKRFIDLGINKDFSFTNPDSS